MGQTVKRFKYHSILYAVTSFTLPQQNQKRLREGDWSLANKGLKISVGLDAF